MRILRHLTANDQKIVPFPFKQELSMQAYIIENEDILSLDSDTFKDVTIIKDELPVKKGRPSKDTDGRIDILINYSSEYFGVVELKLGKLEQDHLEQLEGYLKKSDQLEDYLNEKEKLLVQFPYRNTKGETDIKWIGVLVGSSISSTLAEKISNGYKTNSGVQIAALTIQRFRGTNGEVFVTTDSYFKDLSKSKDTSKYEFEDKILGKGRLVLAVMKRHIEDNPNITYSDLKREFPRNTQGTKGVFGEKLKVDEELSESLSKIKRHFMKPDEIISLSDGSRIYICNQWGIGNIDGFIEAAEEQDHKITKSN